MNTTLQRFKNGQKNKKPPKKGAVNKKKQVVKKKPVKGAVNAPNLGVRLFNAIDRGLDNFLDIIEGKNSKPQPKKKKPQTKKPQKINDVKLKKRKMDEPRKKVATSSPRNWKKTSPKEEEKPRTIQQKKVLGNLTGFNKARSVFSSRMKREESEGGSIFGTFKTTKIEKAESVKELKQKYEVKKEEKPNLLKQFTLKRNKKEVEEDKKSIVKEEKKIIAPKKKRNEFQMTFDRIKAGKKKQEPKKVERKLEEPKKEAKKEEEKKEKSKLWRKKKDVVKGAKVKIEKKGDNEIQQTLKRLRKVNSDEEPPKKTFKTAKKKQQKISSRKHSSDSVSNTDTTPPKEVAVKKKEVIKKKVSKKEIKKKRSKKEKKKTQRKKGKTLNRFFTRKKRLDVNNLVILEDDELDVRKTRSPSASHPKENTLSKEQTMWKKPSLNIEDVNNIQDDISINSISTMPKNKTPTTNKLFKFFKKKKEEEKTSVISDPEPEVRDEPEQALPAMKHGSFSSETSKALSEGLLALSQMQNEPMTDPNQFSYLGGDSTLESFTLKLKQIKEAAPKQQEQEYIPPENKIMVKDIVGKEKKGFKLKAPTFKKKPKADKTVDKIPMSKSIVIIEEPLVGKHDTEDNLLRVAEHLKREKLTSQQREQKTKQIQQLEKKDGFFNIEKQAPPPPPPPPATKINSPAPESARFHSRGDLTPEEYFKQKIKPQMNTPASPNFQSMKHESLPQTVLSEMEYEELAQVYGDEPDEENVRNEREVDDYLYGDNNQYEEPKRKKRRRKKKKRLPSYQPVEKVRNRGSEASTSSTNSRNEYVIGDDSEGEYRPATTRHFELDSYDEDDAYATDNENEYIVG
eukprot:maker-scaffold_10-snap-gene-6.44-mRNA-1 protein AED:0.20 eAED:0.20 QI:134/1/0.5/1/1/1/2/0/850